MLQLLPATHVYLPVSSVETPVISREPLGIFWNLEEKSNLKAELLNSREDVPQRR